MQFMKCIFGLIFFFCCMTTLFATPLSSKEAEIKAAVINNRVQQLKLLKQLVDINSGTNNTRGVRQVGNIVRKKLNSMGFKTWWAEEPKGLHRAGTLFAIKKGTNGKKLLLIGHLDTVFPKDSDFQHFKMQSIDEAVGPGVADDKGGVVVILSALKALQQAGVLKNTSILVALTGDEEDSGKPTNLSRHALIAAAKGRDIALDFEPGVDIRSLSIGRRGITGWLLKTTGNEEHSALIFQKEVGVGAIYELAYILNSFREQLHTTSSITFNPGLILGGTRVNYQQEMSRGYAIGKENIIAKFALATGDLRYLTDAQKVDVEKKMQKIINAPLPGTKATMTFQDGIPPMEPTKANLALLNQYSDASMTLGFGPVTPFDAAHRGAGDISYVAHLVPQSLVGLGPIGVSTHSVHETLFIPSLQTQSIRAAVLIYRLTHQS